MIYLIILPVFSFILFAAIDYYIRKYEIKKNTVKISYARAAEINNITREDYVSEKEIVNMAKRLDNEMGGWIFHNHVDFSKPTPWYFIESGHPEVIKNWLQKRS